jgi:ribosomal protein S18 acetylase RimI-like enzyme
MDVQILHDKSKILSFLRNSTELQIYCIGDLDDFFWSKTIWYSLVENNEIKSIALLYVGMEIPTLLIFDSSNSKYPAFLAQKVKPFLPTKFYAHLSAGLIDVFGKQNIIQYYGFNHKMALKNKPFQIEDSNIRRLTISDLPIMEDFYTISYPNNWFDSRMLETKKYFGYFINEKLVGVSGIHVYSADYKVAALGNIATHPDYRGQQIGYKLTSVLCNDLLKTVDFIGLNVKSDNDFAVTCYKKIGFEIIGSYDECLLKNEHH